MDSLMRSFKDPPRYSLDWLQNSTPSRRDGISFDKENQYRVSYCQLILDVGSKLRIPSWAVGTAICYCHRFFAARSMKSNDRFAVAAAAMFLACKVEEVSKGLEVIVREFWEHRCRAMPHQTAEDIQKACAHIYDPRNEVFLDQVKTLVLVAERALLYTLGFDLTTFGVHKLVISLSKELGWDVGHKDVVRSAWNFVNDSLRTTVCLQASSEEIAWAVLLLTARLFELTADLFLPDGRPRWRRAGVPYSAIQSIIEQIMALYDTTAASAGASSPAGTRGV